MTANTPIPRPRAGRAVASRAPSQEMAAAGVAGLRWRDQLDQAFQALCRSRLDAGPHHDIWNLRHHWHQLRGRVSDALRRGTFRFSPVRLIDLKNGHRVEVWDAVDSLVQKMLGLALTPLLAERLSRRCFHLTGRGGIKGGVRALRDALASGEHRFVMRSDVRGYYANIAHAPLLEELRRHVDDPTVLDLVSQYCHRTVVRGGLYRFITKGIPLGSPLSPLMGALYLARLDRRMKALEAKGLFYVRFMDDWVVLAPTRWKLRQAVRTVNGTLAELRVEQHPDKTFVGRVERGFDFLGYHFDGQPSADDPPGTLLPPARTTIARMAGNVARLYEQGAGTDRVGRYLQRWWQWLRAGLQHNDLAPRAAAPAHDGTGPLTLPDRIPADGLIKRTKQRKNEHHENYKHIHGHRRRRRCPAHEIVTETPRRLRLPWGPAFEQPVECGGWV